MVRRLAAAVFLVAGVGGILGAVAPSASADQVITAKETVTIPDSPPSDLCLLRVNITIFGHHIGTGANTICL